MANNHEFYPMITSSVKTIFSLTSPSDESVLVHCLLRYPFISYSEEMLERNKMLSALIQELNRQYARWNKGGANGK